MANLKIVEKYNLPAWVDLGSESGAGIFQFPDTVAFSGKDDDGLFAPTALGFNPFDENTSLSTGGIIINSTGEEGVIGELVTHVVFDQSSGQRNYTVTDLSSDGDKMVAVIRKPRRDPEDEYRDPVTVIFRETTDQEREYSKFVENSWVPPIGDQREAIAEVKKTEEYKKSEDGMKSALEQFEQFKKGLS